MIPFRRGSCPDGFYCPGREKLPGYFFCPDTRVPFFARMPGYLFLPGSRVRITARIQEGHLPGYQLLPGCPDTDNCPDARIQIIARIQWVAVGPRWDWDGTRLVRSPRVCWESINFSSKVGVRSSWNALQTPGRHYFGDCSVPSAAGLPSYIFLMESLAIPVWMLFIREAKPWVLPLALR